MPYKSESKEYKLPREHDKRVKLTEAEREQIKELYGKVSQRKLAKMFNVSRRLIQFIGKPETKERELELRKLRGGSKIYYDRKKHNEAVKNLRKKRHELYKKGELIKNETTNE